MKESGRKRSASHRAGRYVRNVSRSDTDADFYELSLDTKTIARGMSAEPVLTRLCAKHDLTCEDAVQRFCPGAYRGPADGFVSINRGYDPAEDEGRLEQTIWDMVSREVIAVIEGNA